MVVFGQHQHAFAGNLRSGDKGSGDPGRVTLGESESRDLPVPSLVIRV